MIASDHHVGGVPVLLTDTVITDTIITDHQPLHTKHYEGHKLANCDEQR